MAADVAPRAVLSRVQELLSAEAAWSRSVLNLSPAEGLMSRTARRALDSDLASRLSEGLPGCKDRSMPAVMHQWSEGLEQQLSLVGRELFGARHFDWRPTSNSMANAVALSALARPGDLVAVQSLAGGGNVSYQAEGVCGVLGLETVALPGTADFDVDAGSAAEIIARRRPRVVVIGGSKVLFPYDLRRLADAAHSAGASVLFDAAHVGPFVAAGLFNQPLAEGADVMTLGTHKLMGGPVGGMVMTDDDRIAEKVYAATEPGFLQTRDINKYAASAIALAELLEHRSAYAAAIRRNVEALSAALAAAGHRVIGAERGWSRTHMLVLDAGPGAPQWCAELAGNDILVSTCALTTDDPGQPERHGLRLSAAQLTRRGMGPGEMELIARLIHQVALGRDVRSRVEDLARNFGDVRFSFDEAGTDR